MLKILLVEDSPVYVALLKNSLSQIQIPFQIVGTATTIAMALALIKNEKPNVLILDIDLDTENSFQLFDSINYEEYQIIFATGHENFAVDAFDVAAIGYLLKPIVFAQLEKFLLIAQKNIRATAFLESSAQPNNIQKHLTVGTISIPSDKGFDILHLDKIIRFEAINNTTHIFLTDYRKMVSSYNLGKFVDSLTDKGFYQSHRSHFINLAFVKKYLRSGIIILQDDSEIPLSKNNRSEFLAIFSGVNK